MIYVGIGAALLGALMIFLVGIKWLKRQIRAAKIHFAYHPERPADRYRMRKRETGEQ